MNKLTQLRQKITQLKAEKEQLRLFLHEIIEAYYRVVNGSDPEDEKAEVTNE